MTRKIITYILICFSISLFWSESLMAQINSTIMGVRIGYTTKNEMPTLLPEGHFQKHRYDSFELEAFDLKNATFAGIEWEEVSFIIRDGKVTEVSFKNNYIDKTARANLFRDVYNALRKKYPNYEKESLKSDYKYFTDYKMDISLSLRNISCSLSYSTYSKYGYDLMVRGGFLKRDGIKSSDL